LHELRHYIEDADIRAKDSASDPHDTTYVNYQLGLIRERLEKFLAA
jgi:hypothetical protein